mmetsp:Transcript_82619/g.164827  ORF Transcript_82619/g.164827 Transcript_82619/m.164827 type:complete len:384 (-) Transcript_82619:3209-4360(-)
MPPCSPPASPTSTTVPRPSTASRTCMPRTKTSRRSGRAGSTTSSSPAPAAPAGESSSGAGAGWRCSRTCSTAVRNSLTSLRASLTLALIFPSLWVFLSSARCAARSNSSAAATSGPTWATSLSTLPMRKMARCTTRWNSVYARSSGPKVTSTLSALHGSVRAWWSSPTEPCSSTMSCVMGSHAYCCSGQRIMHWLAVHLTLQPTGAFALNLPQTSSAHAESSTSGGRKPSWSVGTYARLRASFTPGRTAGALTQSSSEKGVDQPRVISKANVPCGSEPPAPPVIIRSPPSSCAIVTSRPASCKCVITPLLTSGETEHCLPRCCSGSGSGGASTTHVVPRAEKPEPRSLTCTCTKLPDTSARSVPRSGSPALGEQTSSYSSPGS